MWFKHLNTLDNYFGPEVVQHFNVVLGLSMQEILLYAWDYSHDPECVEANDDT